MANIDVFLQKIQEAVYGEEVRGSIHDAIREVNESAEGSALSAAQFADGAKLSAEKAETQAGKAEQSNAEAHDAAKEAKSSEGNAAESMQEAKEAKEAAASSKMAAADSAAKAEDSADNATEAKNKAKESEESALESKKAAEASAQAAARYEKSASDSVQTANESAENAEKYALDARSYAVGTNGEVRPGDESDNSKAYSDLAKELTEEAKKLLEQAQKIIVAASTGALIPAGTVMFADLPINPQVGYMYNISDDFVTDNRFEGGAGIFYRAGANIYWTKNEQWDVMVGVQVTGVKGAAETTYRTGNVNLTLENIGAAPTSHANTSTTYGASTSEKYGHAMASSTTPKANGIASVGAETAKFARGDHVHPLQTSVSGSSGSCTGNAASATNADKLDGKHAAEFVTLANGGTFAPNARIDFTAAKSGNMLGRQVTVNSSGFCWEEEYLEHGSGSDTYTAEFLRYSSRMAGLRLMHDDYKDGSVFATWYYNYGVLLSEDIMYQININGTAYAFDGYAFWPVEASEDLGKSAAKWTNIYAQNGTIQTSDRTRKTNVTSLPDDLIKDFIMGLLPSSYQMIDGTSGRTHWGLISQDIEELMNRLGMESKDFAGFIKSPKKIIHYTDVSGNPLKKPIEEVIEGEYEYSLRYDEFVAPLIKMLQMQQSEIERLKEDNTKLKERLAKIEMLLELQTI